MPFIKNIIPGIIALFLSYAAQAQSLKAVQQIEGIPPKVAYRAIAHDGSGNLYVATSVDVFMIPSNNNRKFFVLFSILEI